MCVAYGTAVAILPARFAPRRVFCVQDTPPVQPVDLLAYIGAAAAPAAAFAWWALRMSWSAAKRDATIDGIGKSLDALKERVDEHDDLRERMARMEQAVHDMRGSLQRIELAVHARPVGS